jgi:hypothetical protein
MRVSAPITFAEKLPSEMTNAPPKKLLARGFSLVD